MTRMHERGAAGIWTVVAVVAALRAVYGATTIRPGELGEVAVIAACALLAVVAALRVREIGQGF